MNGYFANVCERYTKYTKNTKNTNSILSAFSAKGYGKLVVCLIVKNICMYSKTRKLKKCGKDMRFTLTSKHCKMLYIYVLFS